MGHLHYNRQSNDGIRNIVLVTTMLLISAPLSFLFKVINAASTNIYLGAFLCILLLIGIYYLLSLIQFAQVLEASGDKRFRTYYKIGPVKFNQQKWENAVSVFIEQDEKRYYNLVIKTVNGQTLQMERSPTRKQIDERLDEYKRLLGCS